MRRRDTETITTASRASWDCGEPHLHKVSSHDMQTLRTATTQPSFTPNDPVTIVHAFHVHHELIRLTACTSRVVTYNTSPSSSHADIYTLTTTESALDQMGAISQQGVKSGYHRIHAATSNNQMKESITMRNYSHGIDDTECILPHKKLITWIT